MPSNPARKIMLSALNAALPARCVVSGQPVDRQGMLAPHVWAAMDFINRPYCDTCALPFDFEAGDETLCGDCLQDPPAYGKMRAALKYNEASRDLVLGFKHGDQTHAALAMLPMLRRAADDLLARADCIVPVPLHRWRLFVRRYNQAAIMAHYLGRDVQKRVMADALIRKRATASQGHLSTAEREKNVSGAFALNPRRKTMIAGKNILLIDDVYTTGATIRACTKTLIKGGAARVDVLTLARRMRD